ncbi:MAG: Type 1 glutamine amidotransferase-like domain-containing protein [Lachnospiraceae bacterium]|nr:Type 1 glutamine amidotransferase-like domain-containing protein [Lachnospiraceae bacterium]
MKAMLTSSLGGAFKVNGTRVPSVLIQHNGLLDNLKSIWIQNAKVLIICADPTDYDKNDSVCACLKESFPMSGLSVSHIDKCDDRNLEVVENLEDIDVLILAGGHVPTQNRFMKQLRLKERLLDYNGIIVAWSAGSMNCADIVYASPEFEGEAVDPLYERWITGLGITNINVFPHFQLLKDDYLDGLRIIEDITFADSVGHEIIALNDGSYIMIDDGQTTLYGEAHMIKDGQQMQICKDGENILL